METAATIGAVNCWYARQHHWVTCTLMIPASLRTFWGDALPGRAPW